jgi:flagellar L-ring protein precursor FlgH
MTAICYFGRTAMPRRRGCISALLITAAFGTTAAAQTNSLFRRGGIPAARPPSTQPATASGAAFLAVPPSAGYPQARQDDGPPPPNEVLLSASLIAVQPPRPRKFKVHDRITIIIREEKRATSDSDLKSDRKWEIEAELKKWIRINEECKLVPQVFPQGNPALEFDYEDKYDGKGKVGRKDSLVTRVTATVVDVKPNGDLVLEAKKDIRVDEDRQIIRLTGICRSVDVTIQNTVLSTQLADARIDIQHSGPARDAARRGWLARFWDLIRPF